MRECNGVCPYWSNLMSISELDIPSFLWMISVSFILEREKLLRVSFVYIRGWSLGLSAEKSSFFRYVMNCPTLVFIYSLIFVELNSLCVLVWLSEYWTANMRCFWRSFVESLFGKNTFLSDSECRVYAT